MATDYDAPRLREGDEDKPETLEGLHESGSRTVDLLEDKLRAAQVSFEFHRYKAMHAFANETAVGANRLPITEYQPEAAALAWARSVAFFDKHLR